MKSNTKIISLVFFILSICYVNSIKPDLGSRAVYAARKNVIITEYVTQNSEWYLFVQGYLNINIEKSKFQEFTLQLSGPQQVSVPTWKESDYDECHEKCGQVFKSLKSKGFSEFECDVTNDDFNNLFNQYVLEEPLYNCFLKRSQPRISLDKKNLKTQDSVPLWVEKNNVREIRYFSLNYKFQDPKYCNWLCGIRNQYCTQISTDFYESSNSFYMC